MKIRTIGIITMFIVMSSTYQDALAVIGKIGAPYLQSKKQHPVKNDPNQKKDQSDSSDENKVPIIVISFDKQHVNFSRNLRKAIDDVEAKSAGTYYTILSKVPPGVDKNQNERLNDKFSRNVNSVLEEMQSSGVPSERIHVTSKTTTDVTHQEISVSAE